MSIDAAQFSAWMKSPAEVRCILVEADVKLAVGGAVVTRYLSTTGYTTSPLDVPANTHYVPRVVGGVKFTESLSLEGAVSLSYGDIEMSNQDGGLDTWLDDFWTNRNVRVYIGSPSWERADFRQIFTGVAAGIDARSNDKLNLKLSDKLQRLNNPVTQAKLGGSSPNADKLLPLCFGECHNIEPLLVSQSLLEYQVHAGAIERIIEVRDNGVPVAHTPFLSTGKFRLTSAPAGVVTVSVQGHKPSTYANDVVSIITALVTTYGSADKRFISGDLNTGALAAFQTANSQPVGIYLKERTNVLEACNQLASSVGASVVMSKAGLMSLVKLDLPQGSAGTTVGSADIALRSLEINRLAEVRAGVKLGYCKNWTPQTTLATGVLAEHAAMFTEEWLTTTVADSTTAADYNLFTEPVIEETLLLTGAAATTEATRRLNMFNQQRKVLKYKGYAHLMFEELGAPQTLVHSRFGLTGGVTGQIVSISTDWMSSKVEIEVLI